MPKDIDDDYFYGTGTINEELENFQVYEKNGELHLHDTRTDDVVKVSEDGSLQTESSRITADGEFQINVPSDEPTIPDAVGKAAQLYRSRQSPVVINMESGFQPSEGVNVKNGDYSYIRIRSEDSVVSVADDYEGIFVQAIRAVAPKLETKVDARGLGHSGVYIKNGRAWIDENCGVINAGHFGIQPFNSVIYAAKADFHGAADRGVRAHGASSIMLQQANVSNAGGTGLFLSRGCTIAAEGADFSGAGNMGADIRRSMGQLEEIDVSGATNNGLYARWGSHISAASIVAENCGSGAVSIGNASVVNLDRATISSPGQRAINVGGGSTASANEASISGVEAYSAVSVEDRSDLAFAQASIVNSPVSGPYHLEVSDGSLVNATGATVDGSTVASGDTNFSSLNSVTSNGIIFEDSS